MIGILVIILTIVNWLIYHKIFKVYYLGNMGKSILNEFVRAFVLAIIEAGIIARVGSWFLGVIVFVVMIICAIAGIKGIFKAFKDAKDAFKRDFMSDKEKSAEKESKSPVSEQMSKDIANKAVEVDATEKNTVQVEVDMAEKNTVQVEEGVDVELTEVGSDKVMVIKEVREITGLGLKESKDMVDSVPVIIKKNITMEEAESIKIKIESQGAKVTIK